jgi:lysozyme-related protein Hpa2
LLALAGAAASTSVRADCVIDAANYHRVNPWVLRAILWQESRMQPHAIGHNANGTKDLGIAQINTIHLGRLRQHGIHPEHLMHACVGTYVAGWHLASVIAAHGNNWRGIAAYHSLTPHFNQRYANSLHAILVKWGAIEAGPPPFPNVAPPPAAAGQARATQSRSSGVAPQAQTGGPVAAIVND